MTTDKWKGAEERVQRKAGDALRKAAGDAEEARRLLWCWSKHDNTLRKDLVRMACREAVQQS